MIQPPAWLVTHVGVMLLGGAAAWWVTDLAHTAHASRLQAAAEHERAEAFRWVQAEQKRSASAMAVADTKALAEVRREQEEADRLRACIDSGYGCGLRVKITRSAAKCPDVPGASSSPGLGDRGSEWAELDRDSQQAYFALRDRIPRLEQALKVCVGQWPGAK